MRVAVDCPAPVAMTDPVALPACPDWSPRHDPHFDRDWLAHHMAHLGEFIHPTDVWATNNEWQRSVLRQRAHEAAVIWRRLGMIIEGDRALGYRLVGPGDPPRWLHLHERTEDRAKEPLPGQLMLAVADVR